MWILCIDKEKEEEIQREVLFNYVPKGYNYFSCSKIKEIIIITINNNNTIIKLKIIVEKESFATD